MRVCAIVTCSACYAFCACRKSASRTACCAFCALCALCVCFLRRARAARAACNTATRAAPIVPHRGLRDRNVPCVDNRISLSFAPPPPTHGGPPFLAVAMRRKGVAKGGDVMSRGLGPQPWRTLWRTSGTVDHIHQAGAITLNGCATQCPFAATPLLRISRVIQLVISLVAVFHPIRSLVHRSVPVLMHRLRQRPGTQCVPGCECSCGLSGFAPKHVICIPLGIRITFFHHIVQCILWSLRHAKRLEGQPQSHRSRRVQHGKRSAPLPGTPKK